MLKQILKISVVYLLIMLLLSWKANGEYYLILIFILSLVFGILIFSTILKKHPGSFKGKANTTAYKNSSSNIENLRKISKRPFLFGIENKLLSDDEFYFDDENFYAINNSSQQTIFKLLSIVDLSKTSIRINSRHIWRVKIKQMNNEEVVFRFAHNYTFWNKNFYLFYQKIEQINPAAIQSEWSL